MARIAISGFRLADRNRDFRVGRRRGGFSEAGFVATLGSTGGFRRAEIAKTGLGTARRVPFERDV